MAEKPKCRYDPHCYRTNPGHFREYAHPLQDAKRKVTTADDKESPAIGRSPAAASPPPQAASPSLAGDAPQRTHFATVHFNTEQHGKHNDDRGSGGDGEGAQPSKRVRSETAVPSASLPTHSAEAAPPPSSATSSLDAPLCAKPPPRPSSLGGVRPTSVAEADALLREVFEMPFPAAALLAVYQLCVELDADDPLRALPGLRLVGPFEVLHGLQFPTDADKWRHWRFRHDPPEVQTFAVGPGFHLVFHRDDPAELPTMIAKDSSSSVRGHPTTDTATHEGTGHFTIEGAACDVVLVLAQHLSAGGGCTQERRDAVRAALEKRVTMPVTSRQNVARDRNRTSLATTFHGLGVRVPFDKKTELGYRPMLMSRSTLLSTLKAINSNTISPKARDELDEQLGLADIANDECDFGLGLEMGLNFFTMVTKQNAVLFHAHRLLSMAYSLLGRDLFAHVLALHMPTLASTEPRVVATMTPHVRAP